MPAWTSSSRLAAASGRSSAPNEAKRRKQPLRGERPLIARTALHALLLTFRHPVSRECVKHCAPYPKNLKRALYQLRRAAGRARSSHTPHQALDR